MFRGPADRDPCIPHRSPQDELCSAQLCRADTVLEDVIHPNKCIYMHWVTWLLTFRLINDRLIHNLPLTTAERTKEKHSNLPESRPNTNKRDFPSGFG